MTHFDETVATDMDTTTVLDSTPQFSTESTISMWDPLKDFTTASKKSLNSQYSFPF